MLAAGVPVRTVSGRGHADASTTLGVYANFVDASGQEAAAVMGRLVRRPLAEDQHLDVPASSLIPSAGWPGQ